MSESLTPTEGARFLLERDREEQGGASAVYRTAIFTPTATYEGHVTLVDDGTFSLTEQTLRGATTSPPTKASEELVEMLEMLSKLTARSASKKREDGLSPWPARILRWRGPGRGE